MSTPSFVAFAGHRRLERGSLARVAVAAKRFYDRQIPERLALFDEHTGGTFDLDLRGSEAEVVARLAQHPLAEPGPAQPAKRGPGRPKLGVVSREVSLLPRHWDWLAEQRGGASGALRKLVDAARARVDPELASRRALEAAHKFMWDLAGDLAGFEAASRALFAKDWSAFDAGTADWPADVREQLMRFTASARGAAS